MTEDHCIFAVGQLAAAIPARHVVAIVAMPELSPLPETPSFVLGAFNLRGRGVPVVSLAARLLDQALPPRAADQVIVVDHAGALVGLHVTDVVDVAPLAETSIEDPLAYAHASRHARFLAGLAKEEERLIALLDVASLVTLPDDVPGPRIHATASPEETAILRERARDLAKSPEPEPEARTEVAILEVGGEPIALEATRVREFVRLRELTPVPGTPPHILGVMNLRGTVVTIVDLRPVLALASTAVEPGIAAIVETDEGTIGLAVETAHDVLPLRFMQLEAGARRHQHLAATASLHDAHVLLLDLDQLLSTRILVVSEEASP